MKNIFKNSVLFCLIACMFLSMVACNVIITPIETGTNDEAAETTTPEGDTSNDLLYKLEMQTVFEMAKEAGYTGTLEELIALFKGETGPAGINGITPHIGQNGNWWVGETDLGVSAQGFQGPKGDKGDTGRGVLKMEMVNGELIVYYTDGTSQNLGPITNGDNDDSEKTELVYVVKVTDANNQPIEGVELVLCCGEARVSLSATLANGYTYSELIAQKDYTIRVVRADGYQFEPDYDYTFIQNSNVAYIVLSQATVTPPPTPPQEDEDGMPEKVDLDGYIYRAYVRSNVATGDPFADGNPAFYCEDFWINPAEGEPEDALEYAVYHRNQDIEYDYNVKIRQTQQSRNMTEELNIFYQNGERIDLTIILAKSAAVAATQNLLTDLNSLSNLNLEHEAYDQNSIRELQMGGKLYYLSGDMNISTLDSVAPTVVNLERYEMYTDAIVEYFGGDPLYADVYNVVRAGKWTLDTMLKIAELASVDVDTADGDLGSNPEDQIGYFQYNQSAIYYFYGAGGRITQMNEEGSPEFVIQSSQNQEVFDYIFDKLHPTTRTTARYPHGFSGPRKTHFISNAVTLFTDMTLWDVRKSLYSQASFKYALLPNPVCQEGDDYHAVVYFYNTVHLWAIPNYVENLEIATLMMDVMAAYSNLNRADSTMDAYYTRTLSFTIAPDPDAREIMDIIKNSTVYDIALLYDWGGWATELAELWYKRTGNNHGTLVLDLGNAQTQLDKTIEKFINP